jgi:3'(2'), 5'-bisphosphate nucleotidase
VAGITVESTRSNDAVGSDHALAREVAMAAGRLLLDLRSSLKAGGPQELRRQGDRRSHELITSALRHARPLDGILSEEGADDGSRLRQRRVWIVDPLDGTREFGEPERTDWAVHVALVVDGDPEAAAVALPGRDRTFDTAAPPHPPARRPGRLRIVISRTRAPRMVAELANRLDAELIEMGSAGAKAMAVVLGDADCYVHAGGQFEWDSAAPAGVARAAGLHVSRIDGTPLRYNQPSARLPDLLICRREQTAAVLGALRELIQEVADLPGPQVASAEYGTRRSH